MANGVPLGGLPPKLARGEMISPCNPPPPPVFNVEVIVAFTSYGNRFRHILFARESSFCPAETSLRLFFPTNSFCLFGEFCFVNALWLSHLSFGVGCPPLSGFFHSLHIALNLLLYN